MSICRHAGNISSQQCLIGGKKKKFKEYISNQWTKFQCFKLSLFVRNVYGPLLQETVTKVMTISIVCVMIVVIIDLFPFYSRHESYDCLPVYLTCFGMLCSRIRGRMFSQY